MEQGGRASVHRPGPGQLWAAGCLHRAAGEDGTLGGWVKQGQVCGAAAVLVSVSLSVVLASVGRIRAEGVLMAAQGGVGAQGGAGAGGAATGLERWTASNCP